MSGWVYVISNKAMPGLVKVGFTRRASELRAEELDHTGMPLPYEVEYDVEIIEDPYEIEQKTHQFLSLKHCGKEWFRCSAEEAVAAIKQVSGSRLIRERYIGAEKAKAEALYQQELAAIELRRKQEKEQKELEERLCNEEAIIRKKFDEQIAASFPLRPFWVYWLGGGFLVFIGLAIFNPPKMSDSAAFMSTVLYGAFAGWCLKVYFESKREQSSSYLALEKQRDEELAAVRGGTSSHRGPERNEKWDASHEDKFLTPVRIAILAAVLICAAVAVLTVVSNKPATTDGKEKLTRSVPLPESASLAVKEEEQVRREGDSIGFPLENGEELLRPIFPTGVGRLTVENETSLDAVVKLVEEGRESKLMRYWFVKSKKAVVLDDLGPCVCSLFFSLGKEWDPNNRKFMLNRSYGKYEEPLTFTETKAADGTRSQNYLVRLEEVDGAIPQTRVVDEETFD